MVRLINGMGELNMNHTKVRAYSKKKSVMRFLMAIAVAVAVFLCYQLKKCQWVFIPHNPLTKHFQLTKIVCHPERRAKPEVEGSSHRFYRICRRHCEDPSTRWRSLRMTRLWFIEILNTRSPLEILERGMYFELLCIHSHQLGRFRDVCQCNQQLGAQVIRTPQSSGWQLYQKVQRS